MKTLARDAALSEEKRCDGDARALVEAMCDDPQAFTSLYSRYRDRVYAYLRTRTNTAEDAADLTQQVFLRAFDAIARYRGTDAMLPAWLMRIARNVATDTYRRQRPVTALDLLPAALQPVGEDLEARSAAREEAAELRTLLLTVNAETRELLALRFGADLSISEIAAVTGKSEAAMRKRLQRALYALATQLQGGRQ